MSTRLFLRHTRHLRPHTRYHATLSPTATTPTSPPPQLLYDQITTATNARLRQLNNPDPRFLRHSSPHPTTSSHHLEFPATRLTVLPNGLRVATESSLASRSAYVSVLFDTGSRFEPDRNSGVANFIERVVSNSIPVDAADVGADITGFTEREFSGFTAGLLGKDLGKGVDVLGKVLQDFDLNDGVIDLVRNGIVLAKEQVS